MTMYNLGKTVWAIMVLTCCVQVFAQTKKAAAMAVPTYSQIPFDLTSLRLPARFMGNDIVRLFKAHETLRTVEKSEYETSDQFNKRIELSETKLFMGSGNATMLAFVVPIVSEYDADEHVLNAGVEYPPRYEATTQKRVSNSIPVKRKDTSREYVASNAFGAKINVRETDVENFRIGVNNPEDFPSATSKYWISSSIKTNPDEARRIKSTFLALAVCSIARGEELTVDDTVLREATFENPREYFEQIHVLKVKLLAVWFFDSSSGKIYAKVGPIEVVK